MIIVYRLCVCVCVQYWETAGRCSSSHHHYNIEKSPWDFLLLLFLISHSFSRCALLPKFHRLQQHTKMEREKLISTFLFSSSSSSSRQFFFLSLSSVCVGADPCNLFHSSLRRRRKKSLSLRADCNNQTFTLPDIRHLSVGSRRTVSSPSFYY